MMHPSEIAKEMQTFPFFNCFGESLTLLIATMAKVSQFGPGELLLEQGQQNNSLYFLRKGRLKILVSGEVVARLESPGEVFGEMSVLSRKPASATIQAEDVVSVFVIDVLDFDHVAPKDRDRFQYLLYKIYCEVLTERLRATNEKAKGFEATNRNLEKLVEERTQDVRKSHADLEQQHSTLLAAFSKVADIAETRDRTLQLVDEVYNQKLGPLQQSVDELAAALPGDSRAKAEVTQFLLSDLGASLGALAQLYESEKAIESKKVLFVDLDKKQHLIARLALGGSGVDLDFASSFEEAEGRLEQNFYDLLICDLQLFKVIELAHANNRARQFVVVGSQGLANSVQLLKQMPYVGNLLTRSEDNKQLVIKTILTATTKILNADIFGLEKYLTWGIETKSQKIGRSTERPQAIEQMIAHFKSIGVRSSFLDRAAIVAEEMLMNAIFDAPVKDGKSLYNHLPRNQEVILEENQAATLRYACDGSAIAISVTDPFGYLSPEVIFKYLESCYTGQAGVHNTHKGGAGRGLHQIVENSDVTVVNVRHAVKTEFVSFINLELKERASQEPSLNCFFA